jgi:hypothetical protein
MPGLLPRVATSSSGHPIDLSHVRFCQCPTRWAVDLRDHATAVDALRRSPSEQGEILIFAPEIAIGRQKILYKPKT